MKGVASDEWPEKKNGALSPLENVEVHWVGVLRPRNTRLRMTTIGGRRGGWASH